MKNLLKLLMSLLLLFTLNATFAEENTENDKRVMEVQKEFITKFNDLKEEYKDRMDNKENRDIYFKKKNELFLEYKAALKEKEQWIVDGDKEVFKQKSEDADISETKKESLKEKIKQKIGEVKDIVKQKKEEIKEKVLSQKDQVKAKYKTIYKKKYGEMMSKLGKDKINNLVWKIDTLIEKVNNWTYSDEKKEKLNAMLESLKEIATERLKQLEK